MRSQSISLLVFGLVVSVTAPATAQTVTDGDTLRFGDRRVRLWGIDAPEIHQTCPDRWLAGIEAARKMRELVKGREVTCENRGYDRYGRMIGLCRAGGVDIQAAMVRAGMAWAFVKYSSDYISEEAAAKAQGLGVHALGCEPAWEWRASLRRLGGEVRSVPDALDLIVLEKVLSQRLNQTKLGANKRPYSAAVSESACDVPMQCVFQCPLWTRDL